MCVCVWVCVGVCVCVFVCVAEATPVAASTVVLQSKNKRNKALKVLLGPFKHPKISKEQRVRRKLLSSL